MIGSEKNNRRSTFYRAGSVLRSAQIALLSVCASLLIGVLGYHFLEGLGWLDALLNASMILGGMGPVDRLQTVGGKLFASFYALLAGFVLLATAGVLFAPALHRFLHRFHLEFDERRAPPNER